MKKISILGSTGSIGLQALDVIRLNPDDLKVVALAGGSNINVVESQVREFKPEIVSVPKEEDFRQLRDNLRDHVYPAKIYCGSEGLEGAATAESADLVVGALPGSLGLRPAFLTVRKGKDLALATKEVLVLAGKHFMDEVSYNDQGNEVTLIKRRKGGARQVPGEG